MTDKTIPHSLVAAHELSEHLRNVACGEGFDAHRIEPDSASELLELAEKLARGEAVF